MASKKQSNGLLKILMNVENNNIYICFFTPFLI